MPCRKIISIILPGRPRKMPVVFLFCSVSIEAYKDLSKDELVVELVKMHHELDQLKRLVFGSRQERFVPSAPPEQLGLGLATSATAPVVQSTQAISYTRKAPEVSSQKVSTGRMKLPASLPREEVVIEPTEDVTGWNKIGQEVTEELERIPGKLFVRRYVRPKYARPDGQGVVIAELPSRPIDKGIPGPGLLAQIVIDKYTDHLPVHRQVQRLEREGMKLPASTITDWIGATCSLLEPLYQVHRKRVLGSHYLQADETPIRVQDKDKKEVRTAAITGYIMLRRNDWYSSTTARAGAAKDRQNVSTTSKAIYRPTAMPSTTTLATRQASRYCIVWRMLGVSSTKRKAMT